MKNVSIKIKNREHFKAVQERLFELGLGWSASPHQQVRYLDENIKSVHTCGDNTFYKSTSCNLESEKWATLDDLYEANPEFATQIITNTGTKYEVTEYSPGYLNIGCSVLSVSGIEQMLNEYHFYQNNPTK
jgi:hypothetical protein